MLLVKKYPQYKIVNFDKLDYCASLVNIQEIADYPNYTFVKVRRHLVWFPAIPAEHSRRAAELSRRRPRTLFPPSARTTFVLCC